LKEVTLKEKYNNNLKKERIFKIFALVFLSIVSGLSGYFLGKYYTYDSLEGRVLGFFSSPKIERSDNYVKNPFEKDEDLFDKDEDKITEKEDEKLEEIAESKESVSNSTAQTPCGQSDINKYSENFCYWVREDNGDEAANWGEKLNNCGADFSIDGCWSDTSTESNLKCSQDDYDYAIAYIEAAEKSYEETLIKYQEAEDEYAECIYGDPDCDYSGEPVLAPDVRRELSTQCRELYYDTCEMNDTRDWYAKELNRIEEGIAQQMIVLESCY
jgi:hypothetical protein